MALCNHFNIMVGMPSVQNCTSANGCDPELPLTLSCDASPYGLGAVLSHMPNGVERPVAYTPRTLTTAERNYAQLDKEALVIAWGVKQFHQYFILHS